tara:strand:- start:117 stop:482 length:366 start_codon:yes stop_codon:yes gene_type:complete
MLFGGCSIALVSEGGETKYYIPNKGFVVGGVVPEKSIGMDNEAAFKQMYNRFHFQAQMELNENGSAVMGMWVEDGKIVFDLCNLYDKVESFKVPLEIAAKRKERAIYDLETEREIFVNTGA